MLSAGRNDSAWYFHDGTRLLPQPPPSVPSAGQALFVSGYMDARNPHTGVTGNRVLLGSVELARNDSSTPIFDLTIGQAGQFASFVTLNGSVLEAQVGQVVMQSVTADPDDGDLDGLKDKWEDKFFGGTRGVFYSDDPDADGVNNLGEEALGSDPTDAKSNLRLAITDGREVVLLEWDSAEKRTYAIEVGKELGKFETWKEGIEATPPLNTLEVDRKDLGSPQFFRVRLEVPAAR
jgi:autotransporter adhesin